MSVDHVNKTTKKILKRYIAGYIRYVFVTIL